MKKLFFLFAAGALVAGSACTSSDTTTDTTTDMATTTDTTTTDQELGVVGTGTAVTGRTDTDVDVSSVTNLDDATFMSTAASSNAFEVQAGNIAQQRATDQKVKDYAKMMVEHHTQASQEMNTVASQMSLTLTQALHPMHQEMLDELNNYTGNDFDEKYMDIMERAHKMDIAMFEAKSQNAQNPSVKAFATKTVPTLRNHQQMADDIEDTVD
ncbi:DUF4142 domain-containing protein [Pontibacter sp. Tf4]|uniref:DUF4142 domain-containing protein n=1 Tax=Pontibacter sp. Tf4 TaxID=2761620 RepID=UPI0016242AEA|nr:DUF4142 domain-containing protein [Pontibacter sp. Tf4]MBB6612786.1 DUF4142 domain-containing protein [Pontibacter sp. Tf4]